MTARSVVHLCLASWLGTSGCVHHILVVNDDRDGTGEFIVCTPPESGTDWTCGALQADDVEATTQLVELPIPQALDAAGLKCPNGVAEARLVLRGGTVTSVITECAHPAAPGGL